MAAPRLTHGFVFVSSLAPMVRFYERAFGMTAQPSTDPGFVRMRAASGADIALHLLPEGLRSALAPRDPPAWRDNTAYKLCFETDDLEGLRAAILAHGGQAKAPWSWEGTRFCECTDPEGNVVQIYAAGA